MIHKLIDYYSVTGCEGVSGWHKPNRGAERSKVSLCAAEETWSVFMNGLERTNRFLLNLMSDNFAKNCRTILVLIYIGLF
jgi:hypothetical protein